MSDWKTNPPQAAVDWQIHLVKEHSNYLELADGPLVFDVPKNGLGEPACPECKGFWSLAREQSK